MIARVVGYWGRWGREQMLNGDLKEEGKKEQDYLRVSEQQRKEREGRGRGGSSGETGRSRKGMKRPSCLHEGLTCTRLRDERRDVERGREKI